MDSCDYLILVQQARDGVEEPLWEVMYPQLRRVACRMASQCVDDAVQAAFIKIYNRLDRVDGSKPTTVRALLMKIGVRAMRDEVRKWLRLHRDSQVEVERWDLIRSPEPGVELELTPLLTLYMEYVRENGSFDGAHKHVAKKMGVSISYVSSLFHRECAQFRGERNYVDTQSQIMRSILDGSHSKVGGNGKHH